MKKQIIVFSLPIFGFLLAGANALAAPLAVYTYDGFTYQLWAAPANSTLQDSFGNPLISWSDAEAAAVADGGQLASLTTEAQITAVYNGLIGNGFFQTPNTYPYYNSAWLGGQPLVAGTLSRTDWSWVDGASWTTDDVNNWAAPEPTGDSLGGGLSINRYGTSQWNDNNIGDGGYIVEIATPEPATLALAGLGGLGLMLFRRQRARVSPHY